jgi:predicted alpha/beta superfamily hydrolase
MWGSSLGGVVSFYTVWQYPEVFGAAACMSSTFTHKDDLFERVLNEPKRNVGFYLDSGWPGDNYEVTVAMALILVSRGWRYGRDLIHLCFPRATHDETAWGMRLHLPMQFFTGAVARASRSADGLMNTDAYDVRL